MISAPALALFLAAALSPETAPEASDPDPEEWLVERTETRRAVAAEGPVSVVNPYGNVILRAGNEGEVMALGLAQRHRDDPRRAEVSLVEDGGGVAVRVAYPALAMPEPVEGWERRRVDLTVMVPPEAPVSVETDGGDVEARGLRAPLRIETGRGHVRARVGGEVVAVSEHGELLVQFLSTRWAGPSRLTTKTGPITAELPAGGNAHVRFATAGPLTTDYSVQIERDAASGRKNGSATVGDGGPLLEIESDRGAITLRASLVPEAAPEVGGERQGSAARWEGSPPAPAEVCRSHSPCHARRGEFSIVTSSPSPEVPR